MNILTIIILITAIGVAALVFAVTLIRGGFAKPFCFGRYVWTNSDCAYCAYQTQCKTKVETQFLEQPNLAPVVKKWALEAVPGQYVTGHFHDEVDLTRDIERAYHFYDKLTADAWANFYERNFLLKCKVVGVSDESASE